MHTWIPSDDEMKWLAEKYPKTFDTLYRPRFEYWREQQKAGKRFYNNTLPMLCQICQIPMAFTEPDDPTKICYRESDYLGNKYHFCSDGCKDIFDNEPEKYVQAWMPVQQIYQGNCFEKDADPSAAISIRFSKYCATTTSMSARTATSSKTRRTAKTGCAGPVNLGVSGDAPAAIRIRPTSRRERALIDHSRRQSWPLSRSRKATRAK